MRILLLQDTDWMERNPSHLVHLTERLVQRGHDIRVIDYEIMWGMKEKKEILSRREIFFASRVFNDVRIPVIRPPIIKIPLLDYASMLVTYYREIKRQIREFKPDVILGMDILITALCYQVIRNTQIPLIYYSIDIDHQLIPYRFLRPLGKFLESRNIQKADFVLSINEGLREYTLRMGAVEERTAVIRAGIDPVRYNPDAVDGSHIRQQYGMQEDDFLLLFMGWLYQFSGLQEVATELAKISRDHPEMKMLVVGDGDAYGDLKKIQKDLHLNGQLILAGKQPFDTIPAFIAAADVCILPAHDNAIMHDIVPIKMYEYMAMRKPVIATRLYGIMKEFSDDNGVLYVGDPAETVARAIALKASGAVRAEGVKARRFVEKSTWNAVVDEFETTLGRFI